MSLTKPETPPAAPASTPGRRGSDSRRKLLSAARTLFTARGYHDTRPQDIAKEAGLSNGTFYVHFADKKDCFLEFINETADELDERIAARLRPARTLEERVEACVSAIYDHAEENYGALITAINGPGAIAGEGMPVNPMLARWAAQWSDAVAEMQTRGIVASTVDANVVGNAIVGALTQTTVYGLTSGLGREKTVGDLTAYLVYGLAGVAPGGPRGPVEVPPV